MDSQKQTGKQSGEVIENTFPWKKQTENKPETEPGTAFVAPGLQTGIFPLQFRTMPT